MTLSNSSSCSVGIPGSGCWQQQLNRLPILDHRVGDIALLFVEFSIEFEHRDGLRFDRQKIGNQRFSLLIVLRPQSRPGEVAIFAERHLEISALQMQLREQLTDLRISGLFGQQLIENGLRPGKLFCFDAAGGFRQQIERLGTLGWASCERRLPPWRRG